MSSSKTSCEGHKRFWGGRGMIRRARPALKISAFRMAVLFLSFTSVTLAQREVHEDAKLTASDAAPAPIQYAPLPPNLVFERHVISADETYLIAGQTARPIYSNTLGTLAANLGANRLVADDITTTAPGGCDLRRLEFPVVGKVDPVGIGGPYTVNFALYSNCPGAVPPNSRSGLIIPGTQGQVVFPDDAPRLISFVVAGIVPLPTNFWMGVTFSRNNAGVIVGTPPLTGFSCDAFDFPGFPCNGNLGGFPEQPHASFNAEVYGDITCAESFTAYYNNKPSGSTYNPGANITFADDIELNSDSCQLIAYEVAVKGVGIYAFDLRANCDGGVIPGTEKSFLVGSGTDVQVARFTVDPPVALPRDLWLGSRVNNSTGGFVVTGRQACIGATEDFFGLPGGTGCTSIDPAPGYHAALNLAITCAGAAPIGACCDMFIRDAGGEAVCRQVTEMNCPYPPRFTSLRPTWVLGAPCTPDPFTPQPCGLAACCRADALCQDLTRNQCNAAPPLDSPRQWLMGHYCAADCNANSVPDACEIADGTNRDCNANTVPDECEFTDCNMNCVPDDQDIIAGTSSDCNGNLTPDECDRATCASDPACADCNANGILDECDIADCAADPACTDCNSNAIPDECDIHEGVSRDADANGIPDECEPGACCDGSTGICVEDVTAALCTGDRRSWSVNTLCAELDPPCAGACCDLLTGICTDNVLPSACSGAQQRWTGGATCNEAACEAVTGACCDHDPFGDCTDGLTRAECNCGRCEWTKLALCDDVQCPRDSIPTVSAWGLAILSLLLMTGAKIRFGRGQRREA